MIPLADIERWRDDLIQSRLRGIRTVTDQNGEKIEFKSDSEMAGAIAWAERAIANGEPVKTILFRTSKGL